MWKTRRALAALREENRLLRRDLEVARLNASPSTPTDDLDFVFVVTYGRSGSTLLMGLLNAIPGYLLRGENRNALHHLYTYHSVITEARDVNAKGERLPPEHPWFGIDAYPEDVAVARMRTLAIDTLMRPEPGVRVAGFKEIRWAQTTDPAAFLDFTERLFPGARFILNTRDLDAVANSSWYRKNPDSRAGLEVTDANLREAIRTRGERGYHVHYDDYVADHGVIRGLYEWLDEEFDAEKVARVFGTKYSSSRNWANLKT